MTIQERIVQYPNRKRIIKQTVPGHTNTDSNFFADVSTEAEGTVTQVGTLITATLLNNIAEKIKPITHVIGFTPDCDTVLNVNATNHQTQINAVITSVGNAGGGTIKLREGRYTVNGQIQMYASDVTLEGSPGTIIYDNRTTTGNQRTVIFAGSSAIKNISVKNITFEANTSVDNTSHETIAIMAGTSNVATIENLVIENCTFAIVRGRAISISSNSTVQNNIKIRNNTIYGSGQATPIYGINWALSGIAAGKPIVPMTNCQIYNNYIDCAGMDVFAKASRDIYAIFKDNFIVNTTSPISNPNYVGTVKFLNNCINGALPCLYSHVYGITSGSYTMFIQFIMTESVAQTPPQIAKWLFDRGFCGSNGSPSGSGTKATGAGNRYYPASGSAATGGFARDVYARSATGLTYRHGRDGSASTAIDVPTNAVLSYWHSYTVTPLL